ncbi:putative Heterokaryon incompatibility protein-domain-containing protein [Seiridium cardinale]|uniref:Heterokaryon incompatibility protein-domain-containing protein n=1 Tax=Seiridium cardinale TaxID=138064 RepID=A0ABR2Y3M6_9PEZI
MFKESLLPSINAFRHVEMNSASTECFALATLWPQDCLTSHDWSLEGGHEFTRVRIVTDLSANAPYVALSHMWGKVHTLTLQTTNWVQYGSDIPWSVLPKTFQDGVKTSQALGFRYIWIDSLCILQDSRQDWDEAAATMASVYQNATLVLGASSARTQTQAAVYVRQDIQHCGNSSIDEPLATRAWTFQERLLAQRFMSYNEKELHWECDTSWRCECGVGDYLQQGDHAYELRRSLKDCTLLQAYDKWRFAIVRRYSGRDLTVESDKLQALSAVAKVFEEKLGDLYLAGIWRGDLVASLCWEASMPFSHTLPSCYRAPTEVKIDILDAKSAPSGLNPLGEVSFGYIKVRGPLAQAWIEVDVVGLTSKKHIVLKTEDHGEFIDICEFIADNRLSNPPASTSAGILQESVTRYQPGHDGSSSNETPSNEEGAQPIDAKNRHIMVWCLYNAVGIPGDDPIGDFYVLVYLSWF